MAGAAVATAPSAVAATETITATNSTVTITAAGWGHGRGMSQYGAQQAAKQGLSYDKILAFYYSGTKLEKLPAGNKLRVWITADTDKKLHVYPATGLLIKDDKGHKFTLPTGKNYTKWRISRSGDKRLLYYRDAKGKYKKYSNAKFTLDAKRLWSFENPKAGKVKVYLASGNRTYRGTVALAFKGTGAITVNTVGMEWYLRSVVPSEMPASWSSEALKSQAVAARTYAARYKANLKGAQPYDICNTTACQVYKGTMTEYKASTAAVNATTDRVLTYKGQYAWTEFSSSNGGYSVAGTNDYITAKADPYDLAANQVYATSVKVSTLQKKYPKIGTFKSLAVSRDGKGRFGGRVTSVTLTGASGSQTVSGASFKSALGLRETLMEIAGGLAPDTANYKRWQALGGSKGTALGVFNSTEQKVADGLYAGFEKGVLWWSPDTGSIRLTKLIDQAYRAAGGPVTSKLGFPVKDAASSVKSGLSFKSGTSAIFESGMISCPSDAKDTKNCVVSLG